MWGVIEERPRVSIIKKGRTPPKGTGQGGRGGKLSFKSVNITGRVKSPSVDQQGTNSAAKP